MRVEGASRIDPSDMSWPARLARLGADAPEGLVLFGNRDLLAAPCLGFFCSVRAPGRVIVESYDVARSLSACKGTLIGGFQSPVEREVLRQLLRDSAAVIICPARGVDGMVIPQGWRTAMKEDRLLLLSPFPAAVRRPTSTHAERRNRLAAALSTRVLILHAALGGRLARLAQECSTWGVPLHCLEHPANEDLRLLGATPFSTVPPPSLPPLGREAGRPSGHPLAR